MGLFESGPVSHEGLLYACARQEHVVRQGPLILLDLCGRLLALSVHHAAIILRGGHLHGLVVELREEVLGLLVSAVTPQSRPCRIQAHY